MRPTVDSDSVFLHPAETRAARLVMTGLQRRSAQK